MKLRTRQRLQELSARFYRRHGTSFDASRGRPWPGWQRLWDLLSPRLSPDRELRCLDAGCGNGRFGRFLAERHRKLRYVGVDLDPGLLDAARRELGLLGDASLHACDLLRDDLDELDELDAIAAPASQDLVVLFGVLHHIPGEDDRRRLLRRLARRVAAGGTLVASIWRLDRDAQRFARKTIPWHEWNAARPPGDRIDAADLEPGDVLLGWRGDRHTPRYCHFPTDDEIERLADLDPAMVFTGRYEADGPTGRDNLYMAWQRPALDSTRDGTIAAHANLPAP